MKFDGLNSIKDPVVRRMFQQVQDAFDGFERDYGLVPVKAKSPNASGTDRSAAPPSAKLATVKGIDGKFLIDVENPKDVSGLILHEISTSTTVPFTSSTDVERFGPSDQTSWEILDPNKTKYLQIRSKFTNSLFNRPIIWPGSVYSGVLASSSLSQLNTKMTQTSIVPILTQDGTNQKIRVAASTWRSGTGVTLSYVAGEITVGSHDVYYVYGDDPKKAGILTNGYVATTDPSDLARGDGRVLFGVITLLSNGGAVGSTEGPGGSVIGPGGLIDRGQGIASGTLVTRFNGTVDFIENLVEGNQLLGIAGNAETLKRNPVAAASIPCILLTTNLGLSLTLSPETYLLGGGNNLLKASYMAVGDTITVFDVNSLQTVVDFIATIGFDANRTIYRLYLDSRKYFRAGQVWCYSG